MDKFCIVLFLIIKLLVIVVAPVVFFIFRRNEIKKYLLYIEIASLSLIIIGYIVGFSYITDSTFTNVLNLNMLGESEYADSSHIEDIISVSNSVSSIDADTSLTTHKEKKVYAYNSYDIPLSTKKIQCENGYDYFKYYSDMITSTAMLLSTELDKNIDPIEIYNKVEKAGLIKCGERINKDKFFAMITNEYKVNFSIISASQLENYILNGKTVLLETIGNGSMSCNQSYFLVYDINNSGEYMLLDPNNKSYSYICPDGSTGFGSVLKPNYNNESFDYSYLVSDANRFIVIGGIR